MKIIAFITALLAVLFTAACDGELSGTSDIKKFDNDLQGTWVSNDPSIYKGTLIIDYDRITIKGYTENQTPSGNDDNNRPFKGFTKNIALKGYSEQGKIFIEDRGSWQEGLPYFDWKVNTSPDSKFLRFVFGNRDEILQMQ